MPKSYRIRTQVGVDKAIKVNLEQDFDSINILSLKILQSDIYNRQCSDYGVIVGRVFVNGGFGLPNARVSVFIPLSDEDSTNPVITDIYPYTSISDVSEDGYRYNLLPKEPSYDGHIATGTFPTRQEVLLDQSYIEVYDKYYKYTTRTNESGDYMIFGVPLGTQTIFLDVDLSDIGCFSLVPQDLIQAGQATEAQVDGAKFKSSSNLSELPQIKTLNKIVDIAPLWGEPEICQLGITRVDFDLTSEANVRIEPKAIFMGSIISTTDDDQVRPISCKPKNATGNLCELISGPGQILAIRQTTNVDELGYPILEQHNLEQEGKVIDGDGSYLVNLPMNLDYVYTNEFGEQAISPDPKVGIPTKAKYRFKFKWNNEGGLQNETQRANFLVPNIKEYGWSSSSYVNDPLKTGPTVPLPLPFTLPPLDFSSNVTIPSSGDLINPILTNVAAFQVFIDLPGFPPQLIPYVGDPNVSITGLTAGSTVFINFTPTNPNAPSSIFYTGANGAPNANFTIPGGPTSVTFTAPSDLGLVFEGVTNVSSYSIQINGSPYYGDVQVIPLQNGDSITITPIFVDPLQNAIVTYNYYPDNYFQLLKSYTFSLDWDDYANPQAAIDCEDTFYEFHYNKVYTTAMFLDRYKNGFGRARHLGIKEIDNRSCKSTVNTFPVNDVIRNFDFIFFIFNILMTILTIPLLVILFVAHLVAFLWPLLKYVLIILGIVFLKNAAQQCYTTITESIHAIDEASGVVSSGAGFVVNITNILEILRLVAVLIYQALVCAFQLALAIAFIAVAILAATRIKNFPRIGLPMLSYPDCTTCDCDCGNAPMGDNFDSASVQQGIEADAANQNTGIDLGGFPTSASTSTSFLISSNNVNEYAVEHPNVLQQETDSDPTDETLGNFYCSTNDQYKSFTWLLSDSRIVPGIIVASSLAYKRLSSGSESLDVGNDQDGIPDKTLIHAPQPFLFAADANGGLTNNKRFLGYPQTEAFSQKLNEFNYRDKYFNQSGGVNRIGVKFNYPQNSVGHTDQPLVILAKPGTLENLGVGEIFSFQDPKLSECNINLTGATFYNTITANTVNQFGNNAVTGTSQTGLTIQISVDYANPNDQNNNLTQQYVINNTGSTQTWLKNVIDIEYFQVITGYTYSQFIVNPTYSLTNVQKFPKKYLNHNTVYIYQNECSPYGPQSLEFVKIDTVITGMTDYLDYEILIIARGVDPHSGKHQNEYDISNLFGSSSPNQVVIQGQYYLNVPIQGYANGQKPKSHNFGNNTTAPNLYFPAYNFTIGPSYVDVNGNVRNEFTPFTSTLPYYYLCPDDTTVPSILNYVPSLGLISLGGIGSTNLCVMNQSANRNRFLPLVGIGNPYTNTSTNNYYFGGGSFTASNFSPTSTAGFALYSGSFDFSNDAEIYWPSTGGALKKYAVYSPAYYHYSLPPIDYPDPTLNPNQYLVMRSDRIPTSTRVEDGYGNTGFGLHQNNNFSYFKSTESSVPTISFAPDLNAGQGVHDETDFVQSLTQTLNCENMVSLQCYMGSGNNVMVNPACEVPPDRVKQGCYCLLNYRENDGLIDKLYLVEYPADARLFLEWKTRFTLTLAACRGVFAQTFQNNWINGVLYMFSFAKNTLFPLEQPDEPTYEYCKDIVIFNPINNGFYYRSSPWNGTDFIGVNSPPKNTTLESFYPYYGYNQQRIQFPTTVMDMGPRDKFISQICSGNDLNGYIVDQVRSTSYKDNSDVIQMSFLSRILNSTVIQQMLPIGNPNGGNTEGKGIIQFFNSSREGERIDGDIAQSLGINSEWRVTPYIEENYPNNFVYLGEDNQSPPRPVFGVFFSSSTEEYQYRRRLTPGVDTYTNNNCTVLNFYGYSTDQQVPHYKWQITGPTSNIFGTENNNWVTTSNQNSTGNGFYSQYYQNTDFNNTNEYFLTTSANFGFITNFNSNDIPLVNPSNVTTGDANSKPILVGAPFYFYFGLNNGNTAVDKFIKLYIDTAQQ